MIFMTREILIEHSFAELFPEFTLLVLEAEVSNGLVDAVLQKELDRAIGSIALSGDVDKIKEITTIASTRDAYKRLGKDPNRYRPAAEQLRRRIVKGLGLYTINQLVDLGNLLSLETGFSIGVFDANKVCGNIVLRRGNAKDPFEGIGRGELNVENLPLYVDEIAPFATPTSDSERTKVELTTQKVLIFINSYLPQNSENTAFLEGVVERSKDLLIRFAQAKKVEHWIVQSRQFI